MMGKVIRFTEAELELLARSVALRWSIPETMQRLEGISPVPRTVTSLVKRRNYDSVRQRAEQMKELLAEREAKLDGEGFTVAPKVRDEDKPSASEIWERAKAVTARATRYARDRHHAEVGFVTSRPIGVSFVSDQHIAESGPVNLTRMEEDAKLIRDTPGLYAVLGGDGADNHIKHRAAMVNSGSSPGREWVLYDHYLGIFGTHLLGLISGNHDGWTHDLTGVDVVQMLAERRRLFYAPDYMTLAIKLKRSAEDEESVEYRVKIRHQYRYNSSFNLTHAVKRMWEMDQDDFDVGVICHNHEAALEPFVKMGRTRLALRPGSYQHTTGYSRRFGYPWTNPTCPTVILHPTKKEALGFVDVWQAAGYLRYLRETWPLSDWTEAPWAAQ
jgi:hypothetical protein